MKNKYLFRIGEKIDAQKLVFLTILLMTAHSLILEAGEFKSVIIQTGSRSSKVEINVAELLSDRLGEMNFPVVGIFSELTGYKEKGNELIILFGNPNNHDKLKHLFKEKRIEELTDLSPGPEGFLLKMLRNERKNILIAAGIDDRGCLYSAGELLRNIIVRDGELKIDESLDIRTAPAFEIRGTQFGQSGVAKKIAKVREWTAAETQRVILDYALAGANIFNVSPGPMFDFIKSFGLMTQGGFGANTAGKNVPDEWNASESIGRKGYVCLSVPEAVEFMMEKCENYFKDCPTYDLIKFHGGDGGGCECDKCDPYGLTFIRLFEEMAGIIHKYHPTTKVYFTNQKFDNKDDSAIISYLQQKPRKWLWAWGFGPGSDATTWQPGHRQTHRMDLFKYPGFGPYGLYPREILRQMPPRHKLVYYNEITHWRYSQHGYIQMYPRADRNGDQPPHWSHDIYERRPDQFLTMVYNRLTFYAWPKYYYRVFNDLMRYGIGDISHSSGHHDHFNQWMWQRLLWDPRTTLAEVVHEYCKSWFGEEAAEYMSKAIFQLEENLKEISDCPIDEKTGIDKYYNLVKDAGRLMPENLYKNNWLWRMYMQKASLDKYVKLKVTQQKELQKDIEESVRKNLSGKIQIHYDDLISKINALKDTEEMKNLKEEARIYGEESNQLFGVRNDGYFNLDHDFIGLRWLKRQLKRASNTNNKRERSELLKMITDYEDPGEDGYYDNLGTLNNAPNVVSGYPYDHGQPYLNEMLSEGNRPSQRSMHFTQDEEQGVTLHYRNLDKNANYIVRFTFVRPWFQERYAFRMNQKSQSIYADDIKIVNEIELPYKMSDFFTFEIPQSATKDGELILRLEKASDVAVGDRVSIEQWRNSGGWGTLASEVWLIKKR